MNITTNYNDNMIPCFIFSGYDHCFIFVDPNTNTCCKSDDSITDWLKKNKLSAFEYGRRCQVDYFDALDHGVEHGIFAYFSADEETIYNYSKTINISDALKEIENF